MSKVAVFFDVQNLYHSSKNYGKSKISYKDLILKIGEGREVCLAMAYAAHRSDKDVGSFYGALKAANIEVVSKRVSFKPEKDSDKRKLVAAHFDVEIATDALMVKSEYPDVDTVVLCTGNGAYTYLAEALIKLGLKVEVWSFEPATSKDLIEIVSKFVEIPTSCLLSEQPQREKVTPQACTI